MSAAVADLSVLIADLFCNFAVEGSMAWKWVFAAFISVLVGIPVPSNAENREILLNIADPHGAMLALALVPRAKDLSTWIRNNNLNEVSVEVTQPSRSTVGGADRRAASSIKTQFAVDPRSPASGEPRLKLGAAAAPSVDISRTKETLADLPTCEARMTQQNACKITDIGKQLIQAAASHSRSGSTSLASLMATHGLVADQRSTKKVVVTVDDNSILQHADFVGLVRSKTEKLDAPDAHSAFVVRLARGGGFSIIERRPDAVIDPLSIKFEGEN